MKIRDEAESSEDGIRDYWYADIQTEERGWNLPQFKEVLGSPPPTRNFQEETDAVAEKIVALLLPRDVRTFRKVVRPDLDDRGPGLNEDHFPMDLMRRAILARVIELGYTAERFSSFDAEVPGGREGNKPERIGKKCQWIAYDETIARIADNFRIKVDSAHLEPPGSRTQGNWMIEFRDIDPSLLLRGASPPPRLHRDWWEGPTYDRWANELNDIRWIKNAAGFALRCMTAHHASSLSTCSDPRTRRSIAGTFW